MSSPSTCYVSNDGNLCANTKWLPAEPRQGDASWTEYQNVTLMTECNSEYLYVLATGNPGAFSGANRSRFVVSC